MSDLESTAPYDPRESLVPQASPVGRLGRSALGTQSSLTALIETLGAAIASVFTPGLAARRTVRRVLVLQVLFTGFEALPLVSAVALLIGSSIVFQTSLMVPGADGALLGKILVAVVLRELAPLITAIVVAGRSGTAIATELGNMKVGSEILALISLGIDPPRFVVWPRLCATTVSVLVLMIYFTGMALLGAFLLGQIMGEAGVDGVRSGIAAAALPYDLPLFVAKGVGLGVIVGWLSCHFGLQVRSSPTEVPRMASRAVVTSLLGCVLYNTLLTGGFYYFVGTPLR